MPSFGPMPDPPDPPSDPLEVGAYTNKAVFEWFPVWFRSLGGWEFDHWVLGARGRIMTFSVYVTQGSYHSSGRPPDYVITDQEKRPLNPLATF